MKNRTHIIQFLINTFNYKSYLEIGVRKPSRNYNIIKVDKKYGVDPSPVHGYENDFKMTSDDFFKQNKMKFDLIFIDGDHRMIQTDKDIINSLDCITEHGTIVLHDCNPIEEKHQIEEFTPKLVWNGSVWKSIAKLRCNRKDLDIVVINRDHGVGIIRKGNQELFTDYKTIDEVITFPFLDANREKLLNLITPEEFTKKICEVCNCTHDRDVNASKNILTEGLRLLSAGTAEYTDGDDVRPSNRLLSVKSEAHPISSAVGG